MRKKIVLVALVVLSAALAYAYFAKKTGKINVLVFSKTESFRHESISDGINTIVALGKQHNFSVDTTEDASVFTESRLKNYNVIVFLSTTGDILNDAQQLEMNRWIQAGGGFVGIHAAADTEYGWPWYGELVGAYFDSHPNDPNVRTASINRIDREHISTEHLPDQWETADEWYNYKEIQPGINVLLNLDETSYEGGTNGANHPIAWYREFDGGRSWYTGLGHTSEMYQSEAFRKHLVGGIKYAAGPGLPVNYNNSRVAPEENRFQKVVLDFNLDEPMELDILPGGDILFVERHGNLKLFKKGTEKAEVVGTLDVFDELEDGLLGIAVDPDYQSNNWIYLFYSPVGDAVQRVSRFVFKEEILQKESEKILLTIPTQRDECCHAAGSLEFGKDGELYISLGDNTSPRATGYAPIDEREGRSAWDAQKSSANTMDLRGKILRIVPEEDGTYSIPEGNLFSDPDLGRPEIYVMGVRNPFRMSIDKKTGFLYWGDVGPDAGKDSTTLGSRGYDEINQARLAGNHGWPYFIGNNFPYNDYDFEKEMGGNHFDSKKPVNNSPNNSGAKQLPEATPAFIWYPYAPSVEFPLVGQQGRNAMAGPVYYADDYPASDSRYPAYYDGKLFIYDWMRGWVMAVTLDENGNYERMERFLPSMEFNNPMDIVVGPEGDFYVLEYGTNWFTQNMDARLVHLTFSAENRVPVASIKPSQTIGKTPLSVQFSSAGTIDFDGDELSYTWSFGDGLGKSSEENPEFTFTDPGEYTVSLKVTDPDGERASSKVKIVAGNDLPDIGIELTGNSQFYWSNGAIGYGVTVDDSEDGSLANGIDPSSLIITTDYLARGYDMTEVAQGHQANLAASANLVGRTLVEQSDCKACHQIDDRSVGPTYKAISGKYTGSSTEVDALAKKIINGGSGVWGDLMMSPHPQLTLDEARKMVKYILSFSGKQISGGLPPAGKLVFDKHQPGEMDGKYILSASYTDKGANGILPLTATKVVTLRYPMIQAKDYVSASNSMTFNVKAEDVPLVEEDMTVVLPGHEAEIIYEQLDLTEVGQLKFFIGVVPKYFSGGNMTVRIDDGQGRIIGQGKFEVGLTAMGMKELIVDLENVTGVHDLILQFVNDDPEKMFGALGTMEFIRSQLVN